MTHRALKVLILGSEGFVGNNLADGLSKDHEVSCADLVGGGGRRNYARFDITDPASVQETVRDADVVVDLVAHSLVSSIEGPARNAEVNIMGLLNVLDACTKNRIKKIIFTSASSLIGEPESPEVSEVHPARPRTAYGISKLASEHYLRLYYTMGQLDHVIFRFFNIYGPHQRNGLIPSIHSRIFRNEPLTVFGKGDQIRDYVFIRDVVPFFERAVSGDAADNMTLNMGTGHGTSILDIMHAISDTMDAKPRIEFKEPRPGEIGNFVADTSLLSSTFGDVPATPVGDGIRETVEWLDRNPARS